MRLSLLAAAVLYVSGLAAHASTTTYQINAPLSDGGFFTGTFTYNSSDLFASTLVGATTNSAESGTVSGSPYSEVGGNTTELNFLSDNQQSYINLTYLGSSFAGVLCTTASTNCYGRGSSVTGFASNVNSTANFLGTTTVTQVLATPPMSATPEPSSFALLGTGLLGVAGVIRKRLA